MTLGGAPVGVLPWLLGEVARANAGGRAVFVASDDAAGQALLGAVPFFAPNVRTIWLPAWDTLPYDRASPALKITADRLAAFAALLETAAGPEGRATAKEQAGPTLVVTTVNALLQRVPSRERIGASIATLKVGADFPRERLVEVLRRCGYTRTDTVADAGEYAVRGSLVDVFPAGGAELLRIDYFGDEIESIRRVDPATQRSTGKAESFVLAPASELLLDDDSVRRFRGRWLERFGAGATADPLYQAVSEGRRLSGAEHYLPLFEERLETLFDWFGEQDVMVRDAGSGAAASERFESIADYHDNRVQALGAKAALGTAVYRPLAPDALYLTADEYAERLAAARAHAASAFAAPEARDVLNLDARAAHDFAPERQAAASGGETIYAAVARQVGAARAAGAKVVLAAYTEGSRNRLGGLLTEAGLSGLEAAEGWDAALKAAGKARTPLVVLGLEHGFETGDIRLIAEQDMLGDRLVRRRSAKKADAFLAELSMLNPGDLVVHADHGIGPLHRPAAGERERRRARHGGAGICRRGQALRAGGEPGRSEPLRRRERGRGARPAGRAGLARPQGADEGAHPRDRARAAEDGRRAGAAGGRRAARGGPGLRSLRGPLPLRGDRRPAEGDRRRAGGPERRGARWTDLSAATWASARPRWRCARPMWRRWPGCRWRWCAPRRCSRASTRPAFRERFQGCRWRLGIFRVWCRWRRPSVRARGWRRARWISWWAPTRSWRRAFRSSAWAGDRGRGAALRGDAQGAAEGAEGRRARADADATPIPRTLQMALSGLRDLSVIATPPIDRLAVRTTVAPLTLWSCARRCCASITAAGRVSTWCRESRTFRRGGVSAQAGTRGADGGGARADGGGEIEERMTAFYEHRYDVLLATTIIESGLDIPAANTLIVHRADMFGLAQLYQIRGRVGRAKRRAYAYLTTSADGSMSESAAKRLQVLSSLDSLGAGVPAREPRSGSSRRGQSAGRRAERAYPRGWLRALPVHAGGGDPGR
jgi:transcription-repair coupling factor (superfamily II helicase)